MKKNLTQKIQQPMTRRIKKASIRSNSGLHIPISLSPRPHPRSCFQIDPAHARKDHLEPRSFRTCLYNIYLNVENVHFGFIKHLNRKADLVLRSCLSQKTCSARINPLKCLLVKRYPKFDFPRVAWYRLREQLPETFPCMRTR